jgi:hypothetical protein
MLVSVESRLGRLTYLGDGGERLTLVSRDRGEAFPYCLLISKNRTMYCVSAFNMPDRCYYPLYFVIVVGLLSVYFDIQNVML